MEKSHGIEAKASGRENVNSGFRDVSARRAKSYTLLQ
jgi:hypothetical protein